MSDILAVAGIMAAVVVCLLTARECQPGDPGIMIGGSILVAGCRP